MSDFQGNICYRAGANNTIRINRLKLAIISQSLTSEKCISLHFSEINAKKKHFDC